MNISDEELMVRCKQGEASTFNILVKRHRNKLIGYIKKNFIDDDERAKDLAQKVFLRAFMAAPKYKPIAKFKTWLYRIALNLYRDEYRRRKSQPSVISLYKSFLYSTSDDGYEETYELYETIPDNSFLLPEDILEKEEYKSRLKSAINSLSQKHRTVIVMHVYERLSYDEIAEKIGCPIGTVKSRIHHAIKKLRLKMKSLRLD